ncbi:MAG TPA: MATE family efflux transporter [Roseiflexaceae bacterium]|nr:MATE family efflux transporter [Roseiflexaceae bacterium]HMP40765.1 MATE family efflux transporter [Roseiflexaceae bacterium]
MTTTETGVAAAALPAGPRVLRRRVLGLAAPVIGENLLQTLLGIVDTILVAGLGAVALAGVGAALQVVFVLIAGLSALSVGAAVLVAQAFGAGNLAAANRIARQSLIWAILIGIPITIAGYFVSAPVIGVLGLEPDVMIIGVEYLQITLGTITTLTIMTLLGGVLRGVGDSRTPMLITGLANIFNIILSYGLIYGELFMPALGAAGSAWGTFGSRLLGAILLIWVLWYGRNGVRLSAGRGWRPDLLVGRKIAGIGFPAALEEILIVTALAVLTPIVATLGTVALAAHRVVLNVLSISFLPGFGFAIATTSLVGQAIGARALDEARAVAVISARWASIWMGALGLAFLIFATQFMQIFSSDPDLIAVGAGAIRMVALTQILWAITFAYGGALRGIGDTRTPMIISSIAMWLVVVLAYLAMQIFPQSLALVWMSFVLISPIESLLIWRAWRRVDLTQVKVL